MGERVMRWNKEAAKIAYRRRMMDLDSKYGHLPKRDISFLPKYQMQVDGKTLDW
jgi:hypothetical protein